MTAIALVSLNTDTGVVRRYVRGPGNTAELTTEASFDEWDPLVTDRNYWRLVWRDLQIFRIGQIPPQGPDDTFPPAAGFASA